MRKKRKYDQIVDFIKVFFYCFPRNVRVIFFEYARKIIGKKGQIIRGALLKTLSKECGENVIIFHDVYLSHIENLSLGNNISIHPMSYIDAAGKVRISDNVSIAHATTIMSTSHKYSEIDIPIREQGYIFAETVIKENVWIGAKATIVCGVTIAEGCVIAANSVVNKDTPSNSIVGGCPAKYIKSRIG